jgi:hypothetical protein
VTKCPIILQLRSYKDDEDEDYVEVYVENNKDETFNKSTDLEELGAMLEEASETLLEREGGSMLSEIPIHVKISRKDYMDLTLIDLPGITYNQKD